MHHRFQAARWLSLPALLLIFGGLALEIHIRGKESRARVSLGGALGRVNLPNTAGEQVREHLAEARTLVRYEDHSAAATLLDRISTQVPHSSTHVPAALANRAAGRGDAATRHWQLAARLAPADPELQRRADRALTTALFDQMRPYGRGAAGAGAATLIFLLGVGLLRRRQARRMRRYLDGLSARVHMTVDDRPSTSAALLDAHDDGLLVDVFLKGRYGIRSVAAPKRGPTLHVTLSNAAANRTIRLTPIRDIRHDAVRVLVKPATLRRLRAHPGRWRLLATLGDRRVALATLTVASTATVPLLAS